MIREICKDETFLAQKAAPATAADLGVAQDLMETLIAHKDGCGPRMVCLYMTVKLRLTNMTIRSR